MAILTESPHDDGVSKVYTLSMSAEELEAMKLVHDSGTESRFLRAQQDHLYEVICNSDPELEDSSINDFR